jgi:hypothetical protein
MAVVRGLGEVEQRQDLGAVAGGHPHAEEQDRAREEARLGDTEEEPQPVEPGGAAHPGEQGGDDAPRDHDAGQPDAGAELVEGQVGGDLQDDVADEEDPGREPELGGRHGEVLGHAVRAGEPDGGAVQVVDEEHQGYERHQSCRDLLDG